MRRLMMLAIVACLGFVSGVLPARGASSFRFTKFDAPFAGAVQTEALGMNNQNAVVGDYGSVATGVFHGYLRNATGRFAQIDVPLAGAFGTVPTGINTLAGRLGVIVGSYHSAPGAVGEHCFKLDNGVFTAPIDVPFSGTFGTRCRGINDSGQIVGRYRDSTVVFGHFRRHGFLFSGGTFSTVDVPGATETVVARQINNSGQIVGSYIVNNDLYHGFLLSGGTFSTIDFPGAKETFVAAINNQGDMGGAYVDPEDHVRAFLLSGGTFTTVALPGTIQNASGCNFDCLNFNVGIFGINDKRVITGVYLGTDGNFHGFVGRPGDGDDADANGKGQD